MAIFPGTMLDDTIPMPGEDNSGDDILWGGPGNDDISGGAGNDRLVGGPGGDVLDGGSGHDIASYVSSRMGVHVDLGAAFYDPSSPNAPVRGGDATGDQLSSIEEIWGSNRADKLIGNHAANRLFGNGGNDELIGGGGNDFLRGGMDADELDGGAGKDLLFGDQGVDELMGGAGDDVLFGGQGDDVLKGGAGNDVLEGGAGADAHYGDGRVNADGDMVEDKGNDTAAYTRSDMAVTVNLGGAGTAADPIATGGHATGDTFDGIENLRGSKYDDVLTGDGSANKIYGNQGADMIKGGSELGDDPDTTDTTETDFDLAGDTLYGGQGNDTLYGQGGNDTLMGNMGADKLDGGSGTDTADYSGSAAAVTVDLSKIPRGGTTPVGKGGDAEGDILIGIENLTGSLMYDDVLTLADVTAADLAAGKFEGTTLKGMGGDDTLEGGTGDDTIEGGDGADNIKGNGGVDLLKGGMGNDLLTGGEGNDISTQDRNADDTSDDPVEAGLYGGAGDDTLDGGAGNDKLMGEAGNDTFKVSAGADEMDGGEGSDTVDYSSETDAVNIDLGHATDITQSGSENVANDTLKNIENVIGGSGGDTLIGDKNANVLTGGNGRDVLTGGKGADTFVFGAETGVTGAAITTDSDLSGQVDVVTDFSSRQGDKLDLSALGLSQSELDSLVTDAEILYANKYSLNSHANININVSSPVALLDLRDYTDSFDKSGGFVAVILDSPVATLDADDFLI